MNVDPVQLFDGLRGLDTAPATGLSQVSACADFYFHTEGDEDRSSAWWLEMVGSSHPALDALVSGAAVRPRSAPGAPGLRDRRIIRGQSKARPSAPTRATSYPTPPRSAAEDLQARTRARS
jgi:hypothetical protein